MFDYADPDVQITHTTVQMIVDFNRTGCVLLCTSQKYCKGIVEFAPDVKGESHCGLIMHEEEPGHVIKDNLLYLENVSAVWEKTTDGPIQVEDDGKSPPLLNRYTHHLICPTKVFFFFCFWQHTAFYY